MSTTRDRAPGWYAVKNPTDGTWEPAEYTLTPEAGYAWWYRAGWYTTDHALGCEIGPRLYMPDESNELVAATMEAVVALRDVGCEPSYREAVAARCNKALRTQEAPTRFIRTQWAFPLPPPQCR